MQVPIEAPKEIKRQIAKKLQKNGSLKRIETKIKLGMMVSVEEIKENEKKSHLERLPFKKNNSKVELNALQTVYNYLSSKNLTYTLSTLLEETSIEKSSNNKFNIFNYLFYEEEDEEEEEIKKNILNEEYYSDF